MKHILIALTGEPGKERLEVKSSGLTHLETLGALQVAAQITLKALGTPVAEQKPQAPAPDAGVQP